MAASRTLTQSAGFTRCTAQRCSSGSALRAFQPSQLAGPPRRGRAPPAQLLVTAAAVASGSGSQAPASSSSSAPGQPLPPYSALSVPVYSLSTAAADGGSRTLNLVTYAGPVSLTPRHYAIGLYNHTLSRDNFLATGRGLLQILGEQHADLFELLGRTSGRAVDKIQELKCRGLQLEERGGLTLLADAYGYVELRAVSEPKPCGDHDVVICEVVSYETLRPDVRPLYTGLLREQGRL